VQTRACADAWAPDDGSCAPPEQFANINHVHTRNVTDDWPMTMYCVFLEHDHKKLVQTRMRTHVQMHVQVVMAVTVLEQFATRNAPDD